MSVSVKVQKQRDAARAAKEAAERRNEQSTDTSLALPIRTNKMAGIYTPPAWGRGVGTNCTLPGKGLI